MLLNSLICLKGRDSGLRTMAITVSCYLTVVLWIGLFGSNASVLMAAIFGAPILFLTGQRRCRDANKPQWFGLLTQIPWWLVAIMASLSVSASWWLALTLFGVIGSMLLAIHPSRSVGRFEYGYHGPAVSMRVASNKAPRVEPSINVDLGHSTTDDSVWTSNPESNSSLGAQLQEVIEEAPLTQKQWIFAGVGILSLVVVGLLVSSLFSGDVSSDEKHVVESVPPSVIQPKETVEFRDGFNLSLQTDKLFISWLGDEGDSKILWQLTDAKGDRSCSELRFNDGTTYRPMIVERLVDSSTEATFTPLDTKAIIKDIARRGKVSLCGYNFSLKGSQSDLSKNPSFRAYIE